MTENKLHKGDKIHCKTWKELRRIALQLSSEGYGVAVLGFGDMSDDVFTITEEPE